MAESDDMAEVLDEEADSYRVLGVRPGAPIEEIRLAFRREAMLHHPDRNPGNAAAAARFREVLKAYQVARRAIERRAKASHSEAGSAEPRHTRAHQEPSRRYVRRSSRAAGRALNRFLLFIVFTVGPILFLIFIIWSSTSTDWFSNFRIEEQPGPFDRRSEEGPERPLGRD